MSSAADSTYGYQAKVYVWPTKSGNEEGEGTTVGHASVELEKTANEQTESSYFSFRPVISAFVNPFLGFLPTFGKSYESVQQDIDHEGIKPEQEHVVPLTEKQYRQMNSKIDEMKDDAQKGTLLYQLFPNTSILTPAKALASRRGYEEMSRCPFSGLPMNDDRYQDMRDMQKLRAGHCATTVSDIFSAGGIDFVQKPSSFLPFGMTPNALGKSFSKRR